MLEREGRPDARRAQLLELIDRSPKGKYVPMIKTLMAMFDYKASYRVRQSSLAEVTRTLADWGIGHEFSGGVSSTDYIRLYRLSPERAAQVRAFSSHPPPPEGELAPSSRLSPFELVFQVGEALDDSRMRALSEDLFAAIWTSKPVLLFVESSDEFFALAGGYVAAVMRRRELMIRRGGVEWGLTAPEILSADALKRMLGQLDADSASSTFVRPGAVYLLRDQPDDVLDDERVGLVREVLLPHTYRLRARFDSTSATGSEGRRAADDPRLTDVRAWLATFAGMSAASTEVPLDGLFDLSSLMAEATQIRDALLQRATYTLTDRAFQAGFESTEHMVLKNLVIGHLRSRIPNADVHVERAVVGRARPGADDASEYENEGAFEGEDRSLLARPDVRYPGSVAVEIETFRSLALSGSSPFFALEAKLRRKLRAYSDPERWLVVPNDVALLAEPQLHALVQNLSHTRSDLRVRLATMDLTNGSPIFFTPRPSVRVDVRITGASWREPRKGGDALEQLTWNDVAGYSDLKARLHEDVLAPLQDPSRYAPYNLPTPNGLLLYGLPGCGKSHIGRVLAGEANLVCRRIAPSDLSGLYLGEGTMKTRELFD